MWYVAVAIGLIVLGFVFRYMVFSPRPPGYHHLRRPLPPVPEAPPWPTPTTPAATS